MHQCGQLLSADNSVTKIPAANKPSAEAARSLSFVNHIYWVAVLVLLVIPAQAVTLLKTVPVGTGPVQVVVSPSAHLAYVVNQGSNTVSAIDTHLLTVKKVLTVGSGPVAIAVNPPANLVYVGNQGSGTITPISGITALAPWSVGGTPAALVVDSVLNQLYVMDTARTQIEVLNASTGTLLSTISTALPPKAMALNIATHSLFVACSGASGSVVVIDGIHNLILTTVPVATGTTSISVDPVTNIATLVSPTADLHTNINAANGYTVQTQVGDTGAKPFATSYDSSLPNGFFFDADQGDGNIFFADGSGNVGLGNNYFIGHQGTNGLTTNPTTNQMVVLLGGTDAAYVVDLLNPLFPQVYHLLTVGSGLGVAGAAFDPLTSRLFITNSAANTVSVFDVSPRQQVDAFEGDFSGNSLNFNFVDVNPATGTVYTLRLANLYAINEVAVGAGENGMSRNPAGVTAIPLTNLQSTSLAVNVATNKIYAGDGPGGFYSVDGATNAANKINVVPPNAMIGALAVDYATNQILAWDSVSGNLFVLDGSNNALLKTVPLTPSESASILVDPSRNMVYVGAQDSVFVVNPATGTIVTTFFLHGQVLAGAINPKANRVYMLDNVRELLVVDTSLNSVVTTITLPTFEPLSLTVNPTSGNFYVGMDDGGTGTTHVLEFSGASNKLLKDFSGAAFPALTGAAGLLANALTNTIYVASDRGQSTSVAVIDERSGAISGIAPLYDTATWTLGLDLSSGVVAGADFSYTSLFFPTSDVHGGEGVPINITGKGIVDGQTIASIPLFRTRNVQPSFKVTAASNFGIMSVDMVPTHGFVQVDGWQGTWKPLKLKLVNGTLTSTATVKTSVLAPGMHVLYFYATVGDVATVQAGLPSGNSVGNSPVIGPIGSVVFTVEK
jgi:YVTN family beta-propeller protein